MAITLDEETHDALISKLAEVRDNITPGDSSYVPTTLRMADLMSDRARLRDIKSMTETGKASKEAKKDRLDAIALITGVESKIPAEQITRSRMQKAQLLQLIGEEKQAEAILVQVRKGKKNDDYWTATDLLADLNYSQGNFAIAKKLYGEIQKSKKKNDFALYRLAWIDLNLGADKAAIKKMESLLDKSTLEEGLRQEASRDIVIFYARLPFSQKTVTKIRNYAGRDEKIRLENMKLYAAELKRVGKTKESSLVYVQFLFQSKSKDEAATLSSQVELFENLVQINRNKDANNVLETIVKADCDKECAKYQNIIHRTLRNWAAFEKTKPSKDLIRAFEIFSAMKPLEEGALLFGIKTAQDAKMHKEALTLLAILIKNSKNPATVEQALLAQISSAEKSGDASLREAAYKMYLDRGSEQALKNSVVTELMLVLMQQKKWAEAEVIALREFNKGQDVTVGRTLLDLYRKSAQTEKERLFSLKMSKGKTNNEYFINYKRLSLALVQKRLAGKLVETSDFELLMELAKTSNKTEEKYRILNDAYLVALRIENFEALKSSATELVSLSRKLSAQEKNLVLEKRIFVADLELDYTSSLAFERMISGPETKDKVFRLAIKSRLAGRADKRLENKILSDRSFGSEKRLWVLENRINEGKASFNDLKNNRELVKRSKELHARLTLMLMANAPTRQSKAYVEENSSALRGTLPVLLFSRRERIEVLDKEYKKAAQIRISRAGLKPFLKGVDQRVAAIGHFEKRFVNKEKDSVVVLVARGYLASLNAGFANDLEKGLAMKVSANVRPAFENSLKTQVAHLRGLVSDTEKNFADGWKRSGFEDEFAAILRVAHPLQQKTLLREITFWKEHSLGDVQHGWARVARMESKNGGSSLALMYQNLKKNPFRMELARELAKEEEARGNFLASTFLSQRDRTLGGI